MAAINVAVRGPFQITAVTDREGTTKAVYSDSALSSAITLPYDLNGDQTIYTADASGAKITAALGTWSQVYDVSLRGRRAALELDIDNVPSSDVFSLLDAGRHLIRQDAAKTLTSTTDAQALFDNGTTTLTVGAYRVKGLVALTAMSATSGNAKIDIKGAGEATLGTALVSFKGVDGAVDTAAAVSGSYAAGVASPASAVTAGAGTAMLCEIDGTFEVTTAGTIIPAISLVTAAAAVVTAGSYLLVERIGSTTLAKVG